jgi:hypothetical protein
MQRVEARHSPQGSEMARSILVRVSSPLGWAQSPGKPPPYRSDYMRDEASLQVERGVVELY